MTNKIMRKVKRNLKVNKINTQMSKRKKTIKKRSLRIQLI